MSTPYEKEFTVTAVTEDYIAALDYPGRCTIDRIAVVRLDAPDTASESDEGEITVDIYSRQFVGPAVPVFLITTNQSGKVYLQTKSALAVKVGDQVEVAGSNNDAYNTNHRITQVIDDFNFITNQTYVGDAVGGTANLNIPVAEWELYRVCDQLVGTLGVAFINPACTFKNQDALPNRNIGVNRKIYFRFAFAATYRVAIRSHEGIGIGG